MPISIYYSCFEQSNKCHFHFIFYTNFLFDEQSQDFIELHKNCLSRVTHLMRIFVVYKFVLILALIPKNSHAFPTIDTEWPYFVHLQFTFVTLSITIMWDINFLNTYFQCLLYVIFCTERIKAMFYFPVSYTHLTLPTKRIV